MPNPQHPNSLLPPDGLRWLFLDLNSFFASVEQQDNSALRGKPVAVLPMMSDYTCVIAASREAKLYGIKTGTPVLEAKRLCPKLRCVLARHDRYVTYHHKIFAEVERHIPVTRICSIDEVACRLMDNERHPDFVADLARRIKCGIWGNIGANIHCSIGVAPNAFLAKLASDMQKPDGLVLLTPEQLPERLFALKLTDLPGINTRMEARLNRSGIGTVQAFYNLAPKQARAIWGSVEGERFWYRLHGYDLPELPTHKRMVGHSRMLDTELRDIDKAAAVAQRLTVKAAARLRRYELYAGVFVLKVRAVSGVGWVDVLHLPHAQDNDALLSALRQLWARMQAEMGRVRLKKVSICLVDLCRKDEITGDLFATPAASRPSQKARSEALSTAIDSLNRRYGTNAVQIGYCPPTRAGYVGTKIAFNRIPEQAEFWE